MKHSLFEHRCSASLLLGLLLVGVLALSGCTVLEDYQARLKKSGQAAQIKTQHTAFRSQQGWRKLTYRQADLLAKANAQNSSVEISLREQRGLLLVDGAIAMDFPVATGKSSHPTPKGSYKILDKKQDYASNLYGRIISATGETAVSDADTREDVVPEGGRFAGAKMPYWMRITPTGVGMHVGYVPGRPASHGCIRLKKDVAVELFKILALGSPVTVDSFCASLGGPVGLESVVVGEVSAPAPRPRPKPKPAPPVAPVAPAPTPAPAVPPSPSPEEPVSPAPPSPA
ncbi:MAG: L,D-transpeptidase [Chthoniobacterales bacterium]